MAKQSLFTLLCIIVTFLFISFCGCKKNESLIITDNAIATRGVSLKCELLTTANGYTSQKNIPQSDLSAQWNRGMYQSKTAANELTVTFEDLTCHGVYNYTYVPSGTGVPNDVYRPDYSGENDFLYFEVNAETGELRFISLISSALSKADREAKILPQDTIEQIATEWAAQWISVEDYEKEVRYDDAADNEPDYYTFHFCSKVNGVETTDYLDLQLSDRGTLIYIGASQPGWSWAHKPELESFPVEEAVQYGITTSDFASPVIILKRFGITAEGEVVLLLGLAGTEDEGAVVLVIRKGE